MTTPDREALTGAMRAILDELADTTPRICFWILETEYDEGCGYVPIMVTEDEAGYRAMRGSGELAQPWYWGTDLGTAQRLADEVNARMGLTRDDVLAIVASSMAAQNTQEDSA